MHCEYANLTLTISEHLVTVTSKFPSCRKATAPPLAPALFYWYEGDLCVPKRIHSGAQHLGVPTPTSTHKLTLTTHLPRTRSCGLISPSWMSDKRTARHRIHTRCCIRCPVREQYQDEYTQRTRARSLSPPLESPRYEQHNIRQIHTCVMDCAHNPTHNRETTHVSHFTNVPERHCRRSQTPLSQGARRPHLREQSCPT